jgi:hypothetical protein
MSEPSAGGNGSGDHPSRDRSGPLPRPHAARGLALVVVAVVVGALLLPSATRAPLVSAAIATTTTTTVAGGGSGHHHGPASSSTTTTTVVPSSIHVLVANATSTNGVAGAVTTFLSSKGFATLPAVNALVKVGSTEIYTVGGATGDVGAVVSALSLPPTSIEPAAQAAPVASTTGANVVVVAGPDLAARFGPGSTATTG